MLLRARYVFPVDGPPIADGVVHIKGERIVGVERASSGAAVDLGNVAILPGLINAHTHLEFSDISQPLGEAGMAFPDWIRLVLPYRLSQPDRTYWDAAIEGGLDESFRWGTTTLGEITYGDRLPPDRNGAPAIVAFQETIGMRNEAIEPGPDRATSFLEGQTGDHGLSPHAPYTVRPALMGRLVELCTTKKAPVAVHLAESTEELEFLRSQSGPIRDLLVERNFWDSDAFYPGTRPLDYLRLLAHAPRALVIHGNYLDDEEHDFLAAHAQQMTVIYCPRTHAFFRHTAYPLAKMLARGVHVAVGTDSRASNPDLSVLAELRLVARQHQGVSPDAVLRLGTIDAARALGRDATVGSITPGKQADLAVVRLPEREAHDPHELLFDSQEEVAAVYWRGQCVIPLSP